MVKISDEKQSTNLEKKGGEENIEEKLESPPKKETKASQRSFKILFKYLFSGLSFVLLLIIAIWYLYRPQGNLYLAINEGIKKYETEINDIFISASSRTQRIAEFQGKLNLKFLYDGRADNTVPNIGLKNVMRFGDAVDLNLEFGIEKGPIKFSGKIYPENILTKLYSVFNYIDYYLIVTTFSDDPSSSVDFNKIRMNARIHPKQNVGINIPEEKFVGFDKVVDRLSFHIYEMFSVDKDSKSNCDQNVCFEEMSHNGYSLEKTVSGFRFLFEGRNHPSCRGLDDYECLKMAENEFEEAFSLDNNNAHARFGLALVKLGMASNSLELNSAFTVGKLLMDSAYHLQAAQKSSAYIKRLLESESWNNLLKKMPGYMDLKVTPEFINTAHFFREAQMAYGRGDYAKTIELISKIQKPEGFESYVSTLEYQAKASQAETPLVRKKLLDEMKLLGKNSKDDWLWNQTIGMLACQWNDDDPDLQKMALDHLQKAIILAPDREEIINNIILKSSCHAFIGDHEMAKTVVSKAEKELEYIGEEYKKNKRYAGIYLDLGYFYAQSNDFKNIAKSLSKAFYHRPDYIKRINKDSTFNEFRKSDFYIELRLKYFRRQ